MAPDTSSFRNRKPPQGVSTRVLLVAAVVLLVAGVTCASLWIIRYRLHEQVSHDFAADLARSVETFEGVEAQRRTELQRENALLADLPSLKALMTTSDDRTIADGAIEFWKVSGNDLFALAARDGRVPAVYTRGTPATQTLRDDLQAALQQIDKHYLLSDGRLFEYSVRPLYFGDHATGTLLGYVITGYAMNTAFVTQISRPSSAEAVFVADGQIAASTLPASDGAGSQDMFRQFTSTSARTIVLRDGRYLATSMDLSANANGPLRLVILKSLRDADREVQQINRLIAAVGLFAVLIGCVFMLVVSGWLTRPLEALARSVRAFGTGDSNHPLSARGTREVRELSAEFDRMRKQIQEANRALLEAERLATIGRMASSVSHDLRHYLAAVYANAEFLASSRLSDTERAELFADIRLAVLGTTDLIDSMLVFSRTGQAVQRAPERIAQLIDRTVALVSAHPDADGVGIHADATDGTDIIAVVDAKLVERAIYNLVLNGCQSARGSAGQPSVLVETSVKSKYVCVLVTDNGPGVPEGIRGSLFEPFVSEGKQKGTGLGLTLTQRIAEEHGGTVELLRSRPGETVFMLSLKREAHHDEASPSEDAPSAQERSHERH